MNEELRQKAMDAVADELGDAYDCMRVWEAWSYGTMGPDDFWPVANSEDRVADITTAATAPYAEYITKLEARIAELEKSAAQAVTTRKDEPCQ